MASQSITEASPARGGGSRFHARAAQRRLSGGERVWVLSLVLAVVAATIYLQAIHGHRQAPGPFQVPWWAIAGAFGLAEVFAVHVQIQRESYSYSLSEIPLVIGLFFLRPDLLIVAQCVGAAVALAVYRRQSALKLVFNVAHLALEVGLATVVFRSVAGSVDPSGPMTWLGAFLATTATVSVADLAVWIAMSLSQDRFEVQLLAQGLWFSRVMQLTNTGLGILAAALLWWSPILAGFLLVPTVAVLLAYRAYNRQRERGETLEFLQETTKRLQQATGFEEAVHVLLSEARRLFRADVSEFLELPEGVDGTALRTALGPGEAVDVMRPIDLDPTEGVWARVAAEGEPILLQRPITNERLDRYFSELGIRDAMVAPLHGGGANDRQVTGIILVANRLSEISTFDHEDLRVFATLAYHVEAAVQNSSLLGQLRDSLERLTELNRMKDEFVAVVSHELRTPLTVMQGTVKTMLQGASPLSSTDRRDLLGAADRAGDRLRRLIEQLLTASTIDSGEQRIARERVSLVDVTRRVAEEFGARGEGSRLFVLVPDDLPPVVGDGRKILQIVTNLVDNAYKYSPPASPVTVTALRDGEEVLVSVSDEGDGVPPGCQDAIFDRFYQVDSSATRAAGGVGLGLYICRKLSEQLGGTLRLERSDKRGSVFTLSLPVEPRQMTLLASEEGPLGGTAIIGSTESEDGSDGEQAPYPPPRSQAVLP